jgi:hypothetical protein
MQPETISMGPVSRFLACCLLPAKEEEEEGLHSLIKRRTARTATDKKTTLSRAQKSAGCRPKSDTHPFRLREEKRGLSLSPFRLRRARDIDCCFAHCGSNPRLLDLSQARYYCTSGTAGVMQHHHPIAYIRKNRHI